eukprot:jgi/Psemu1/49680/gm1.49680_g
MSSSNKTTTSSPDKPSGNPPGIPSDKDPPSTQPAAKETPSGKPENPITKPMLKLVPKETPKATPKTTPSGNVLGFVNACLFDSSDDEDPPPFQKEDLIVLLNKCDSFPKHLKVAFLKDFTQNDILALVENSAKSNLLKIFQYCYHSMGATISSMNRNWGISYVAKFAKELKKTKPKKIAAHNAKIGKLTTVWPLQHHGASLCQWENKSTATKLKTKKPHKKPTQ